MARAKKASRKRYRRSNYSRWYRRRRYRRRYPKRSGRRFPKDTEVKSVSNEYSMSMFAEPSGDNITYYPGYISYVGNSITGRNLLGIPQGTAQGQRIGAKVEPIKLRISGAISLAAKESGQANNAPNFWQVRLIIYQVKGGNSAYGLDQAQYHQLAIENTNGFVSGNQLKNILQTFYYVSTDTAGNTFAFSDWLGNNNLAKVPLRRGIGGTLRVLYKKSFWINTQKNPVKQFRLVTRKPRRLVYPESAASGQDNSLDIDANNGIYILWLFQPGGFNTTTVPSINLNYAVDLFYTDK